MRRYSTWLLFVLLILVGVQPALAQPPGDPDAADPGELITGIVSVNGAVVYAGPDFAYRIVGQLPLNGSVTVRGRSGDFIRRWSGDEWLEIDFEGGSGWVYARLIRTSIPFNSIPPTGRALPRNRNGRVPDTFDLSDNICDRWGGQFTQSGTILGPDTDIVVTYPPLEGANVYSVVVIAPSGQRTAYDSETTTATIQDRKLRSRNEYGTYTWRVAPYWSNTTWRGGWQQICLLETGGTFERPEPQE